MKQKKTQTTRPIASNILWQRSPFPALPILKHLVHPHCFFKFSPESNSLRLRVERKPRVRMRHTESIIVSVFSFLPPSFRFLFGFFYMNGFFLSNEHAAATNRSLEHWTLTWSLLTSQLFFNHGYGYVGNLLFRSWMILMVTSFKLVIIVSTLFASND